MQAPADKAALDREFSEFYREHLRDVYNYTYYRTGNHHDAEDLTTQTFIQAYRHFERAQRESNGRPLRPWLIRIAHNLAANYYRDRTRKPTSTLEDVERRSASRTTPRSWSSGVKKPLRCSRACSSLPDDRREALIMRFALGMDNREIARALGRTEGATKVLIHRAIKQLEQDLQLDAGEEDVMSDASRPGASAERRRGRDHAAAGAGAHAGRAAGELRRRSSRPGSRASRRRRSRRSRSSPTGRSRRCATRATGCARPPPWPSAPRPAPRWWCSSCARSRRRQAPGLRGIAEQGGKVASDAVSSARGLIRSAYAAATNFSRAAARPVCYVCARRR